MLDYEDDWTEEDMRDLTIHSMRHAEEENPYEDDLIEQEMVAVEFREKIPAMIKALADATTSEGIEVRPT
ncbi:MAG TPA: hypothetical protein VJ183_08795 [Chloroflexia bacterium]|nr:hypothetical protein [Chloroflexia bacterium]